MENEYILREAKVYSVDDEYDGMRIKVRLGGLDGHLSDEDLPYCFPLLPKLIHIAPKVGEAVIVILGRCGAATSNRYYIGPILSQPYFYKEELYDLSALNMLLNRKTTPIQKAERDPLNDGTLPNIEDVALIGRENADITLKTNEVRLRCGYKSTPNGRVEERLHFNEINPAYIQMKYKEMTDSKGDTFNSVVNVIADKINLINHTYSIDRKDVVHEDDLMDFINNSGHPLVYGDDVIALLKDILNIIQTHTHPFAMCPPKFDKSDLKVFDTNLNAMLSDTVRIS